MAYLGRFSGSFSSPTREKIPGLSKGPSVNFEIFHETKTFRISELTPPTHPFKTKPNIFFFYEARKRHCFSSACMCRQLPCTWMYNIRTLRSQLVSRIMVMSLWWEYKVQYNHVTCEVTSYSRQLSCCPRFLFFFFCILRLRTQRL